MSTRKEAVSRRKFLKLSGAGLASAVLFGVGCNRGGNQGEQNGSGGQAAQQVQAGTLDAPEVAKPCAGNCPFKGQTVTVSVNTAGRQGPISGPLF